MPPASTVAPNKFIFELDGVRCGLLKSYTGGGVSATIAEVPHDYYSKKHIAGLNYEPCVMQVGFSMDESYYEWISTSWTGNTTRRDGSIIIADHQFQAKSRRDFHGALITETTIPAMDGSSHEAGHLTVKISPEYISYKSDSGQVSVEPAQQRQWSVSNFKLEIPDIDCKRVSKISPITVTQRSVAEAVGAFRDAPAGSRRLEFSNLRITFSAIDAKSWQDWLEDFVIKGNNGDDRERTGKLTLLAANLKDEMAHLDFFNLGIISLGPEPSGSGNLIAELYCERMEFDVP
ncbi:MAG TPA: phage tail protein [Pyrinomonadaceae bacterium]|nr:phage tail protein [Pyrinomonadaceae bacterium]